MSKSKEILPGILRTRKKYNSWQHIAVVKLDELLKEEFEVLWAYIRGVKNPLSNEDYLFFEFKYRHCCTAIEKIVFYFSNNKYYKNFSTEENLLYKGKQVLALLELMHNIYDHKEYQKDTLFSFKTMHYIKHILDMLLELLTDLINADEKHILIREINN